MLTGEQRTEAIKELRRELKMRLRVYPGLIERGRMTEVEMQRRINLVRLVIEELERGGDQGELF